MVTEIVTRQSKHSSYLSIRDERVDLILWMGEELWVLTCKVFDDRAFFPRAERSHVVRILILDFSS